MRSNLAYKYEFSDYEDDYNDENLDEVGEVDELEDDEEEYLIAQLPMPLPTHASLAYGTSRNYTLAQPAWLPTEHFDLNGYVVASPIYNRNYSAGQYVKAWLAANWKILAGVLVVFGVLALGVNLLISSHKSETYDIYNFENGSNSTVNVNDDLKISSMSLKGGVANGSNLEGKPSISVAKIEQVLQSYNSPAKGVGQAMYDLGTKYGIDPAYALAFFIHESSAGTQGIATVTKSIGNIRQTNDSGFDAYQGFRKYPSWEVGLEDWYKLIRNVYINGWNLRSVEAVIPRYAPAADNNNELAYVKQVNTLVASWRDGK